MRPLASTSGRLHNGPICPTCGRGYVSTHQCDTAELRRQAMALLRTADAIDLSNKPMPPLDRTASCPCLPENGGSGICGCIMGGLKITCQAG